MKAKLKHLVRSLLIRFGYKLETIYMESGNEMWRFGRGYNNRRPFVRLDWGSKGWRITEINPVVAHANGRPMRQAEWDEFRKGIEGSAGPVGR